MPDGTQPDESVPGSGLSRRLDRLTARVRALFVPSVTAAALIDARDARDPAAVVLQLYSWERERLFTLAKGLAGAGVTVLGSLVLEGVKDDSAAVPAVLVYAAAGLVVALLLWAGFVLTGLRRLAEEYPVAVAVVTFERR